MELYLFIDLFQRPHVHQDNQPGSLPEARNVSNQQVDDLSGRGRVRHVEGFKVIAAGQLVGDPGNARRGGAAVGNDNALNRIVFTGEGVKCAA